MVGVALACVLPLLATLAIYIVHENPGTAIQHSGLGTARRYVITASGWLSVSFVISAWYLSRTVARPAGLALVAVTVVHFLLAVSGTPLGLPSMWVQLAGNLLGLLALVFGLLLLRASWRVCSPGK